MPEPEPGIAPAAPAPDVAGAVSPSATAGAATDPVSRIEFEAALLRQEHRLHAILKNFFLKRKDYPLGDPRRDATTEALLWRIGVALVPTVAAGGAGIVAVIGNCARCPASRGARPEPARKEQKSPKSGNAVKRVPTGQQRRLMPDRLARVPALGDRSRVLSSVLGIAMEPHLVNCRAVNVYCLADKIRLYPHSGCRADWIRRNRRKAQSDV